MEMHEPLYALKLLYLLVAFLPMWDGPSRAAHKSEGHASASLSRLGECGKGLEE
jgi:hypothetical protein